MTDYDKHKQIDDYLRGRMSKEEADEFEKRLLLDSDLAEEVSISKNLFALFDTDEWDPIDELDSNGYAYQEFLMSDEADTISNAITEARDAYRKTSLPLHQPKRRTQWYAAAASFVVLMALSYTFMFNNNATPEALFAEYNNQTELPSLTLRSDADKLLADAESQFNNRDFDAAIETLNTYENRFGNKFYSIRLYKGLCYLNTNRYDNAIAEFNALRDSNSLDKNRAHWYLALTHLKQNNLVKAKEELNTITQYNYFNHKAAAQLLRKLD